MTLKQRGPPRAGAALVRWGAASATAGAARRSDAGSYWIRPISCLMRVSTGDPAPSMFVITAAT
jgi:hypothetical protein